MDIRIVDYGASNLGSVRNALDNLGFEARIARTPEEVLAADQLILPGVGAAGEAMEKIRARGLDEALHQAVRERGRPLLGICLGMEILARRLFEYGDHRGLGWIEGDVVALREVVGEAPRVPHMGWNRIEPAAGADNLLAKVRGKRDFYFAHSYTLKVADPSVVSATTDYEGKLVAAVQWDNVLAVQFHPEKSQLPGERLLQAFLEWRP